MSLARMQKVRLIGHESERNCILTILQELGAVQISVLTNKNPQSLKGFVPKPSTSGDLESKLAELHYALDFTARYDKEKGGFVQGFFNLKDVISQEELSTIAREYDYLPVCRRMRTLDQELSELRSEKTQLETLKAELTPWANLKISLEKLRSTETTAFLLGRLPKGKFADLLRILQAQFSGLVLVEKVSEDEKSLFAYAVVPRELEEQFFKASAEQGWERLVLPNLSGLPKELLAQVERRLAEIEQKQAELVRQAEALIPEKRKLQALYEYLHNEHLKAQVQAYLIGSPNTFLLEGWIRECDLPRLHEALRGKLVYVETRPPLPEEQPPVALQNRRWARPVEFVIQLFGLPRPTELDPTPFVAPFFIVFYGLAVSDAGVGLGLLALMYFIKRRFKSEGAQKLAHLGIAGAISAIIVGVLMGSWWGPQLLDLFPVLKDLQLSFFKPADPKAPIDSNGIMLFLAIVLGLGYLHLLLANALEWYDQARTGRFWHGLWVQGSWLVFLLGVGLLAGVGIPQMLQKLGLPAHWGPLGSALALAGALMIGLLAGVREGRSQMPWIVCALALYLFLLNLMDLLGGPSWLWTLVAITGVLVPLWREGARGLLRHIGAALFRLYSATGYLGDVISYARLMALGISTGLIGMAFNIIAFEVVLNRLFAGLPYYGYGLGILVALFALLFGHTLNLILSGFGAFVHTARLHYVEFFTKFYEAGGEKFSPFSLQWKYYNVQTE